MSDPFPQLRALQDRISQVVDEVGMEVVALEFVPHDEYGNLVHFIVNVKQNTLKTTEEVDKDTVNETFDQLMGGFDVTVAEDGNVALSEVETKEPEDPALEEAEVNMQERARERARQALEADDG